MEGGLKAVITSFLYHCNLYFKNGTRSHKSLTKAILKFLSQDSHGSKFQLRESYLRHLTWKHSYNHHLDDNNNHNQQHMVLLYSTDKHDSRRFANMCICVGYRIAIFTCIWLGKIFIWEETSNVSIGHTWRIALFYYIVRQHGTSKQMDSKKSTKIEH